MKKILLLCISVCVSMSVFATENPHKELKFSCETCHTVESFKDMSFDHTLTGYELQGRHQSADCKGCHDVSDFSKVKSNCLSCHNDIHQAKMGNDCQDCHTTRGWEQFDIEAMHLNTNFPLSGKHALVDCQGCHTTMPSGDFSFNTTRCIKCHQSDYLAVNSPNHVQLGFSTDCESCHQMDLWRPAYFDNHDILFPIFSGEHKNEWDDCRSCHTDPSSYQTFSCLNCHEHPQTKTDADHSGIGGYAYNSPDCYFCHPTGTAGDFADHDAQSFPIFSGVHNNEWNDCNVCHVNPIDRKDFSCYQSCHAQAETDNIHNGMTGYAYNSSDCYACHPTGEKGLYVEHDAQFFPIYSGTHNNEWNDCNVCHTNPVNRTEVSCLSCHTQTESDNMHGAMSGYSYDSPSCISCHPTGLKGTFTSHETEFFPIFSGAHKDPWNDCVDCHTNATTRLTFSCFNCHSQPDMDDKHLGKIDGYAYDSDLCYSCHLDGKN